MSEKTPIGAHEAWYEPDSGFVHKVIRGTMNADEVRQLTAFVLKFANDGAVYCLINYRESKGLTKEARKVTAEIGAASILQNYCAIFGASFAVRTILNLVLKTTEIAQGKPFPVRFTADESEAREWLSERKRAHDARTR
ncbi:MAG TPA: STAS/SEC14 domain-containing protein [Labilithrix sp.]|nr:STAS/SEC14 domain-containing protein [Labilithrix sp.]